MLKIAYVCVRLLKRKEAKALEISWEIRVNKMVAGAGFEPATSGL